MTLREKVAEIMPQEVSTKFGGGVNNCPEHYKFLNGHYDVKKAEEICKTSGFTCNRCWGMRYIEDAEKTPDKNSNNVKVGTKWWDKENNITFFIIEVRGDNVIIEGEIISCSVVSKEYLLEHCKRIDDTDINVGNISNNVNHPKHYQGKYECIEEMIELFGIDAVISFCKCNVYKYRFRATNKNGQEDIEKAENYMTILFDLEKRKRTGNI